ncbi:MAG: thiamine phosphate synthase [Calditerrivibrio sp.]|nr:thiamine phosphate synthase [Calditerrivibrio sp.]MCA1932353.1 thiamine phosphate synthase [Calditerrivibrio sp.]
MCSKYRQKISDYLKLYLIFESDMLQIPLDDFVQQVVEGGVTAIQLRDKKLTSKERYENGLRIKDMLKDKDVMLSMNDRLDLSITLGIDVIHVGVKDIPPYVIKDLYPDMLAGYSCNNLDDIYTAEKSCVDYIGVGPAFETSTKDDLRPVIGPHGIGKLVGLTKIPAVAIGGIKLSNCEVLANIGVKGVAVSSELCRSKKPYEVAKKFREFFP